MSFNILTHSRFVFICFNMLCNFVFITLRNINISSQTNLSFEKWYQVTRWWIQIDCEFILRYIMNLNQCIIISILVHKIRWMFNDRHKKTLKTCYIFVYFDNNSFKHYIVSCQFEMIGKSIKLSRKRKYIIIIWKPHTQEAQI